MAVVVVLPEPCSPTIMIGTGAERIEVDRLALRAECLNQLVVHELDHELAWRHRFDQLDADRVRLHLLGEGAHHLERYVGLEQGAAHFAQRRIDVGLGQRAAAREPVENAAKPFRQRVEHRSKYLNSVFSPENASTKQL